jgi:hypothetical protein
MEKQAGGNEDLDHKVVAMRDGGASWLEIQEVFQLTRQQARYAYQRGKRVERRQSRRKGSQ